VAPHPAADHRAGAADPAAAVDEDRMPVGNRLVDRIEDPAHLLLGRDAEVADRHAPVLDVLNLVRREPALLGQVDHEVDPRRERLR
jgi:hypothetical protein